VEFELGKLEEEQFYASFFQDGTAIDGAGLKRCVAGAYRWVEGMEPLLAELQAQGVAMHALSNYPSWVDLIDQRLGLSRYLELSFVSCHTGLRKPDPQAFLAACDKLGVAPSDCLLVDDRAQNCAAAQALGMHALRFQGDVLAVRQALSDAGML
jgi:FMN phosphatase YigB (HAD superfamily)